MPDILLQIVSGLSTGAVYASLALALVMIYRGTHDLNFAQGEMATLTCYVVATLLGLGVPYWLSVGLAMVLGAAVSVATYIVIVRPIGRDDDTRSVVALIGIYLVINGLVGWLWGHDPRDVRTPFSDALALPLLGLSAHAAGAIITVVVVAAVLQAAFLFSRWGLAMRAASEFPTSSLFTGIRVDRTRITGWAIASALGTLSGVLVAPTVLLEPNMMLGVLIYGFAAALLGGITSPLGATAAGFLVGVTENLVGSYLVGTQLKLTVTLLLIVAVLTIRPQGLFGTAAGRRA